MPLHLRIRHGIYHYSRTVPGDVRGVVGCKYWRFTLGTKNVREAEAARSEWDAKYQAQIDEIRRMTGADKIRAIRSQHRPRQDGLAPVGSTVRGIDVHGLPLSKTDIHRLSGKTREARATFADSEAQVVFNAQTLLPILSPKEQKAVTQAGGVEAFYKAVKRERKKRVILGDYRSSDERRERTASRLASQTLLAEDEAILAKLGLPVDLNETPETPDNPRILTALEKFLMSKKKKRAQSTMVKYRLHIQRLADFTGNITLGSLAPQKVAEFIEAYHDLPNARALGLEQRKLGMRELLALRKLKPELPAYGVVNVIKMTEYVRAFFKAVKRPDLRAAVERPEDDRPREVKHEGYPPIEPRQLGLLLSSIDDAFGVDSDTAWWIRLLAFSGMRPEEAAQLSRSNVYKIGDAWALKIDDLEQRRVKNDQSPRIVPVHPKLIELGFIEFARPNGDSSGLVFRSFEYDDKAQRSNNPSRRLKRLLKKLGITGTGSAHRFRATFIDAIRNAELPYAVELKLVGHGDKKNRVHGKYGVGAHFNTLARNIGKVDPLAEPSASYSD